MPIEDVEKKLYTPEKPTLPELEKIEPAKTEEPSLIVPPPDTGSFSSSSWQRIRIGAAVLLVLSLSLAAFVFYTGFRAFRKGNVDLKLTGPDNIVAGEKAIWKVAIVNRNATPLLEGVLTFRFPDYATNPMESSGSDFTPVIGLTQKIDIAELKPGGLFEKEFAATVIGGEKASRQVQALLEFKPSSGTIVFESIATKDMAISSFPITLAVGTLKETVSGESVELKIDLKNEGETAFNNIRARLEYPSGFKIKESSEKLSDFNNVWNLDEVLPQEKKTLTIKGQVSGIVGEGKVFRVLVEGREGESWKLYKEVSSQLNIISSPLAVDIKTDPESVTSASPSQNVVFKVTWQNNLDVPLDSIVLKARITDDDAIDYKSLFTSGSFNASSKTITWDQSNIPTLASLGPSGKGEASFQFKTKDKISSGEIKVDVTGESPTKPEGIAVSKVSSQSSIVINVNDR